MVNNHLVYIHYIKTSGSAGIQSVTFTTTETTYDLQSIIPDFSRISTLELRNDANNMNVGFVTLIAE